KLIDEAGNNLPPIAATTRLFEQDTIINGFALGDFVLTQLINYIGEPTTALFRKTDLDEPFGRFLGRDYGCNVDMAAWIKLLSKGQAVYIAEPLSSLRMHNEQQSQSFKMMVLGIADWTHQIITARQLDFLKKEVNFKVAASRCLKNIAGLLHMAAVNDQEDLIEKGDLKQLASELMMELLAGYGGKKFAGFANTDFLPPAVDPSRPGVSIIVVTYNSRRTIALCLESLISHTGPQDEIILVDNASQDATMQFVGAFVEKHPGRIKVIHSEKNLGFSQGTNLGLDAATKEYVALLNPDVEVTSGWLDRMIGYLIADPHVGAVGPTTDYVAGLQKVGLYIEGVQLTNWDAISDILAARNRGQGKETLLLIGFCLLTRRSLLKDLGNLDPNLFLGNDDLDLSLRLRQKGYKLLVATDVFVHHFGQVSFSTEPGHRTKYLVQQSTNALYEKLYRHYHGKVPPAEELWGMSWFTPQTGLASIVILIHNNLELAQQCITAVYRHTPRDFELILVDNGSTEDVASYAAELQQTCGNVTYIRNELDQGYAYGGNQGFAAARGEYVALLNNGVVVSDGWLGKLLALLAIDPAIGMVGIQANNAGVQQPKGISYKDEDMADFDELAARHFLERAGSFTMALRVTGGCMVMRREVIDKVGGFDTCYREANLADDDLCLRVKRAGYQIALAQDVFVYYHEAATLGAVPSDTERLLEEDWRFFCHKWNHQGKRVEEYPATELAQARPFDFAWDHIPPRYADIFHPDAEPLDLAISQPVRFLCIPDWENPAWRQAVATYATTFKPSDPVSLIIRVEPLLLENVESALRQIASLLQELGLSESNVADIFLETSKIPPRRRGGLYTAATAFIPCAGSRAALYAREAGACGVPMVDELSGDTLRRLAHTSRPQRKRNPKLTALTSIVILTHNELEYTRRCVESIQKHTNEPYELIFVDNGSSDGTLEYLQSLSDARVITNPINLGFGAGCNQGMSAAKGEYIVLLNNDTVVTEGWLTRMINWVEADPSVGMVGPRSNYVVGPQMVNPVPYGDDLSRMHEFAAKFSAENAGTSFQVLRLVGFCVLIKRAVIEKIGGFDERFGKGNFEDDDFCIRAGMAGFKLLVCNDVFIHHYGSRTFAGAKMDYLEMMRRNWKKFKDKWDLPVDKPMEYGYSAAEVLNRVFDAELHYSPLPQSPDDFTAGMDPAFNEKRGFSFLVMLDWPGMQASLRTVLDAYLAAFKADDDVSLIMLVEDVGDNEEMNLQSAENWLVEAIKVKGLEVDSIPDILLSRSPDSPRNRLALYKSVQAYIPTGELLEEVHRKELQACGCLVVEECTPFQLEKVAGIRPARQTAAS
ncbi:MAG: glycosyltransferase, partial [Bacillota bacterium]